MAVKVKIQITFTASRCHYSHNQHTQPHSELSDVQMPVRGETIWNSVYLLLTKTFNKTGTPHVIQLTDLHVHIVAKHLKKTIKST